MDANSKVREWGGEIASLSGTVKRLMKMSARTTAWGLLIAGVVSMVFTKQFGPERTWLGFLPGVSAIIILVGCLLVIRWHFRPDGGMPICGRRLLTIAGAILLVISILNPYLFIVPFEFFGG
jgi:hypothetical protein